MTLEELGIAADRKRKFTKTLAKVGLARSQRQLG
jgi:hypothetical protein